MARWHKEYGPKGLVVLSVYDGLTPSVDDLRKHVEKGKIPYPVMRDPGDNQKTYGIKFGTTVYLIGADGKVMWEGLANKKQDALEGEIKSALEKVDKKRLETWKKEQGGGK